MRVSKAIGLEFRPNDFGSHSIETQALSCEQHPWIV